MTKRILFAIFLSLLFTSVLAGAAFAQSATPQPIESITDDQVNAVAKQLFCPVCENIPLDVCPTQACAEWRELIRLRLSQGWTEEEIKADFARQYGDRVLAAPPAKGLNVMVYVIPPIAILAGVVILVQSLRSLRRGTQQPVAESSQAAEAQPAAPAPGEMDDYMRRVEEELRKR